MSTHFDALLVDLDGLLADTEHLGQAALAEAWEKESHLPPLSAEELDLYVGRLDEEALADVASRRQLEGDELTVLHRSYRRLYLEKLKGHPIRPLPGVRQGLIPLAGKTPLALVTGSTEEQARVVLDRLGLRDGELWGAVVTADEVGEGKPSPEPYRRAAAALGAPIHRCLVVEDSEPGVVAGRAAGAAVLHVGEFHPQVSWIADRQVSRLDQIDEALLEDLWARRPLPAQPDVHVLRGLARTARREGLAGRLQLPGGEDLWSAYRGVTRRNLDRPGTVGELLWKLFVRASAVSEEAFEIVRQELDLESAELALRRGDGRRWARVRLLVLESTLLLKEPPRTLPDGRWLSADTYLENSSVHFLHDVVGKLEDDESMEPQRILEIGTGTGLCLAELLRRYEGAFGVGTDLSGRAVHLARTNLALNGLERRSRVVQGDLFEGLAESGPFDLVVFNPPYRIMPPEIPYPDPLSRYGVGPDGLGVVRRFLGDVAKFLRPGGRALVHVELPIVADEPERYETCLRRAAKNLELSFETTGEPISVRSIVVKGAEKCLQGDPAALERRLEEAYDELGIAHLQPSLIEALYKVEKGTP